MHDAVCLSPDGGLLATSGWHSHTINVWKVATGELLKQFTSGSPAGFSPNSKQLITSAPKEYTIWNVENWEPVRRIERSDCSYSSSMAFSPLGDLLALELTSGALHLLRTTDFSTVVILECPQRNRPTRFSFCRTDQRLISYHHRKGEVYVWDLRKLRSDLALLGLDWEDPESSHPPASDAASDGSLAVLSFPKSIEFMPSTTSATNELETARQSLQTAERLFAEKPKSPSAANNLAWQILTSPKELRDATRAVELLENAGNEIQLDANFRNTLAVAYYRAGRFAEAIAYLRQNVEAQEDANMGYDLYFLAMCYWQMNEHAHARETFEWAERMLRLKPPSDANAAKELENFRTEARELLGI